MTDDTNIGFIIDYSTDTTDLEQNLENIQEKLVEIQDQLIEHEISTSTIEYIPLREYIGFKKDKQKILRPFEQWIHDKYIGKTK